MKERLSPIGCYNEALDRLDAATDQSYLDANLASALRQEAQVLATLSLFKDNTPPNWGPFQ